VDAELCFASRRGVARIRWEKKPVDRLDAAALAGDEDALV
jgi:hypothetical protein